MAAAAPAPYADLRQMIGGMSVDPATIQWSNPELINKLTAGGFFHETTTGDASTGNTPDARWNLDWQGAVNAGIIPKETFGNVTDVTDPFKIGQQSKLGGYRGYDPNNPNFKIVNPNLVWNDPLFGTTTFQNNVYEPQDKGFLGMLPTIGKLIVGGALGMAGGYVGAGLLGGGIGSLIGKTGVGLVESGGQNPLSGLFSLISGGNKTGSATTQQGNELALLLALLANQRGLR